MKKHFKKILCAVLTLAMLMPLTSCKLGKEKNAKTTYADMTYSFKSEYMTIPDVMSEINNIQIIGEKMYLFGYSNKNDKGQDVYEPKMASMNIDGTGVVEIPYVKVSNAVNGGNIGNPKIDNEGNIWYSENVFPQANNGDVGTEDGILPMPMPREATSRAFANSSNVSIEMSPTKPSGNGLTEELFLHKIDTTGKELLCVKMNEYAADESGYFYIGNMAFGKDGNVYIISDMRIMVFDKEMKHQYDIQNDNYLNELVFSKITNKAYVRYYGEKGEVFAEVDFAAKKISTEPISLPTTSYNYNILPGNDTYDFYLDDRITLSGYNIGAEPVKILNWIDSDVNPNSINSISVASDKKIYCVERDFTSKEAKTNIISLSKRTADEMQPKEQLTFASNWMNDDVQKAIINFNKTNGKYRIKVTNYSQYNTEENYELGTQKFNSDITSGKMPDIIQIDSVMPFDSYAAKGLFMDIYPLIEKDKTIDLKDYFANILKAFEVNGKLYEIVPTFSISTVVGKESIFGDKQSITTTEIQNILKEMPEGTQIFADMTKSQMLNSSLYISGGNYVNKDTGVCSYNSESFIKLLELANTFPKEIDQSAWEDPKYYGIYEKMYRDNKVLLAMNTIYSADSLHRTEKVTFGEKVSFLGFPTEDANAKGSSILPGMELAISAKTKCVDGAWEFVKYFLSEDYQSTLEYQMPISIKQFDANAKKAMTPRTYTDENGEVVEEKNTYWQNGMEIDIGYPTQDEMDRIRALIDTMTTVRRYDQNLMEIITEESESYFSGQKTAAQVADIIQNRAQIYLSEIR